MLCSLCRMCRQAPGFAAWTALFLDYVFVDETAALSDAWETPAELWKADTSLLEISILGHDPTTSRSCARPEGARIPNPGLDVCVRSVLRLSLAFRLCKPPVQYPRVDRRRPIERLDCDSPGQIMSRPPRYIPRTSLPPPVRTSSRSSMDGFPHPCAYCTGNHGNPRRFAHPARLPTPTCHLCHLRD
jgi:hypothetical protein